MVRVFVSTFGYDWSHVVAVFSSFGGCAGDVVCLICPESEDERFLSSISQLRLILKNLAGVENIRIFHVSTEDFPNCICGITRSLLEITNSVQFSELIVDVGGGLRMLVVSTLLSLLLLSSIGVLDVRKVSIVCFHEGRRKICQISGSIIKLFTEFNRLTSEKFAILLKLYNGKEDAVTIRDLSYELNKDITTIKRQSEILEELGVVNIVRTGRSTYLKKSSLTDLAISIKRIFEHENIQNTKS